MGIDNISMDSAHRNSLQPGHLVHWFKIERILGQGGFGITYLAIDTNLNRQVAIKEYLPVEIAVRDSNNSLYPISDNRSDQYSFGLSRFIEEAQTLAKFDHHNIVRVMTVFEANNTAYMVMRYEEGECLDNILKARKTLNEKTLKNILFPILDGLEIVHAEGFIHRDIKPANIYIRMDGSPVLLDFGAARQSLGVATKTLTSMVSSGYAPFEQYFSKSDQQGPWTDIYALGATMYRGITSKMPMDAVDRSNTILQLSRDTFVYTAEIGQEDYSEAFLKAVDSALQFKYQDRPQSIIDWKSEFKLQRFIAEKKPAIKVKQEDIPTKETTQTNNTPITKPKKASSKPKIAAIASIIFTILISSYFLYSKSGFNLKKEDEDLPEKIVLTAQEEIELRRKGLKSLEEKAEQRRINAEALAKLEEEKKRKAVEEKDRIIVDAAITKAKDEEVNKLIVQINKAVKDQEFDLAKKLLADANVLGSESINLKITRKNYETQYSNWQQEQKRIEQVKQLLISAKNNVDKNRLSTPKENNALEQYQKVLKLESDNEAAKEGVLKIFNLYITLAQESIKVESYENAKDYLDKASQIMPDSQEVITITDELIPKLAEAEKERKEEEVKAEKLAEEKRLAEQKKLEEAETKRLAEEKQLAEAKAAKQLEEKRLAEEAAAKQAKNSKAGEFIKIPGGTLKSVTIAPFEMGKYEITQGQWKSVMGSNPSQNKNCGDKCPVENVKWDEVQDFIKKLNSESGVKYRLPTAAEWEYACALGGSKDQCTGSNIHALFLGSGLKQGQNKPVGYAPPDSSGVANLRDQIWEWTCSKYSSTSTSRDAECEYKDKYVTHAVRGGKSVHVDINSATALRNWNHYALRYPVIGFRLVVSK